MRIHAPIILPLVIGAVLSTLSCATKKPQTQEFMTAPGIYDGEEIDPFRGYENWGTADSLGILYATMRKEAGPDDREPFYLNERDNILSLGMARVSLADKEADWGELKEIDLLKGTNKDYPFGITETIPFGPLEEALYGLVDPARLPADRGEASRKYAEIINNRLALNPIKEITIYVHGFNTTFDGPVLVATELWHYLGYRGAFIAFSWPSSQSVFNYVADVDTAEYTATAFRQFLEFLAENTVAEKINILGYSAGTKLVTHALHQLGLKTSHLDEEEAKKTTKLGKVVFVAADVERQLTGQFIGDSLLRDLESFTVYMSAKDGALKTSANVHKQPRLGQTWADGDAGQSTVDFIRSHRKLTFIDVTDVPGEHGNYSHGYFRMNPWVSSDLLMFLATGMDPASRGLVRRGNQIYWSFPEDYIDTLKVNVAAYLAEE